MNADGTFSIQNWDASPYDAIAPRFAAFIFDDLYPLSWPEYVMENYPIHDAIFEGAWTWTFLDRSSCLDPNAPCEGVSWIPQRPQATPVPGVPNQNFCDRPPQLPVGLPCEGCMDSPGSLPPAEPISRTTLIAMAAAGATTPLPASVVVPPPSATPSPTSTATQVLYETLLSPSPPASPSPVFLRGYEQSSGAASLVSHIGVSVVIAGALAWLVL